MAPRPSGSKEDSEKKTINFWPLSPFLNSFFPHFLNSKPNWHSSHNRRVAYPSGAARRRWRRSLGRPSAGVPTTDRHWRTRSCSGAARPSCCWVEVAAAVASAAAAAAAVAVATVVAAVVRGRALSLRRRTTASSAWALLRQRPGTAHPHDGTYNRGGARNLN